MATLKKKGLAGTPVRPAKAPVKKASAFAKSPLGKLVEAMREIPASKIKVWPVAPQ